MVALASVLLGAFTLGFAGLAAGFAGKVRGMEGYHADAGLLAT